MVKSKLLIENTAFIKKTRKLKHLTQQDKNRQTRKATVVQRATA